MRSVIGLAVYVLGVPALLFLSAGTLRWPLAWTYVALSLAATIGTRLLLLRKHPDLLRERAKATRAPGTQPWDRVLGPVVALYGPAVTMIIAGLDRRFGWTPEIPPAGRYLALVVVVASYVLASWAMLVNRYFSAVARIQSDRDQVVVSHGPYGLVRHPAYAGALLATLSTPVLLDAPPALLAAIVVAAALIVRTGLEDGMLRRELTGYEEYSGRVRSRLIPGVW